MAVTAQNYFQYAFDRYPIAWDEGPFLYRTLNYARNKVALDLDLTTREEFSLENNPNSLTLSKNFLAVRKVYLVNNNFQILLKRKPNLFQPFKYALKPLNYVLKAPNKIYLLPQDYKADENDKIVIDYVPILDPMQRLSDEETYIPETALDLVVLQICLRLAENDLQYAMKGYFEAEYKLRLATLQRGAF